MADLSRLWIVLGLKSEGIKAGLQDINSDIKKSEKEWKRSFGAIEQQMTSLGTKMAVLGAAISAAIGLTVKSYASAGGAVYDMAKKTGFTTEAISKLKYAAEQSGTSIDTVVIAVKNLNNALVSAGEGSATTIKAFERIGLKLSDIKGLSPEDQFIKVATALSKVTDQSIKSATAVDLFGKSGTDLLPLLSEGADGIQELMDRAVELGVVFDDISARKAKDMEDAITDLTTSFAGLKNELGAVLSDILKPYIETTTDAISGTRQWAEENKVLSGLLGTLAVDSGVALTSLGALSLMLPKLTALFRTFNLSLSSGLGITALAAAGITAVQFGTSQLKKSGDISAEISGYNAQGSQQNWSLDLEAAEKYEKALRERIALFEEMGKGKAQGKQINGVMDLTDPLSPAQREQVARDRELADSIKTQIDNIKKLKAEQVAAEYDKQQKAIEECNTAIVRINEQITLENTNLATAKERQQNLESAIKDTTKTIEDYRKKISDANAELEKLANPRLEGMQEYEDKAQAIQEQIDQLNLQRLQSTSPREQRDLQKQIDALEKEREVLDAESKVKFGPDIYKAKEAVEESQGLNKEMTPDAVMARIKELSTSINNDTALLATAEGTLSSLTTASGNLQTDIESIEKSLENWNTQLKLFSDNLEKLGYTPSIETTEIVPHAQGGIFTKPHIGLIAENGPEAIIPLNKPSIPALSSLSTGFNFNANNFSRNITVTVPVYLDSYQIAQAVGEVQDNDYRTQL